MPGRGRVVKKSTAWVLLLCTGVPTPALWRSDKPKVSAGSSPRTTMRVVTRPTVPARGQRASARPGPVWLSDDPQVADLLAQLPPVRTTRKQPQPASSSAASPPPAPRVRRQAAPKTTRQPAKTTPVPAPAPQKKAPAAPARAPRTKAEKRAAERASWPSSWDQLASGWDQTRG